MQIYFKINNSFIFHCDLEFSFLYYTFVLSNKNKMKKTFKIGEYVVGGIIEVNYNNAKNVLTIAFLDWNTKEVIKEYITDNFNLYTENDIYYFLCDNGTPYYADMVWEFVAKFWALKFNEVCAN